MLPLQRQAPNDGCAIAVGPGCLSVRACASAAAAERAEQWMQSHTSSAVACAWVACIERCVRIASPLALSFVWQRLQRRSVGQLRSLVRSLATPAAATPRAHTTRSMERVEAAAPPGAIALVVRDATSSAVAALSLRGRCATRSLCRCCHHSTAQRPRVALHR